MNAFPLNVRDDIKRFIQFGQKIGNDLFKSELKNLYSNPDKELCYSLINDQSLWLYNDNKLV